MNNMIILLHLLNENSIIFCFSSKVFLAIVEQVEESLRIAVNSTTVVKEHKKNSKQFTLVHQ